MHLTLQNQLRLMGLLTVLLLSAVVGFSALNLRSLQHEFRDYQSSRDTHQQLIEIKAAALSVTRDDPILPETASHLKAVDTRVRALFARIAASVNGTAEEQHAKSAAELWQGYAKGIAGAIKIASDSPEDALSIPDAMYKLKLVPMVEQLDAMSRTFEQADNAARGRIDATMSRILMVVLLPLAGVGLVILIFQAMFSRGLCRRIGGVIEVMEKLRNGDLRHRLPANRKDEIGRMAEVINGFIGYFVDILNDVKQAAETTEATARNVNEMTHKVNTNAESQSDRFYQVSAAIEQMGHSLAEMVNTVGHAAGSASETRGTVGRGNDTGRETVSALNRIDASMADSARTIGDLESAIERIGNVSQIIKEIAEQTNLLALNAAIEAARAGEHGRGFAVVAEEVRKLANRTAVSTNDIAEIVTTIQQSTTRATTAMGRARDEVRSGVAFGEEMGRLLGEIDRSVHQMAEMMHTIAAATEEQSATGNEIARNVETVSEITSSTRRDIDATRNAMGDLVNVSTRLRGAVDRFQLSGAAA